MISVHEEAEQLTQSSEDWVVEVTEERSREATAPDGTEGELLDAVVVLTRR